eukprot:TRINITY_DN63582_c0_g1_i1.p1 TRINITY_DN63582_c0_g1~~TRINITY_DN63582_c0_g1_i1.p1  ORF type:complete len:220 (-),score=34.56 TRINITY_DN63582_c0_g1_i1:23-682(-)
MHAKLSRPQMRHKAATGPAQEEERSVCSGSTCISVGDESVESSDDSASSADESGMDESEESVSHDTSGDRVAAACRYEKPQCSPQSSKFLLVEQRIASLRRGRGSGFFREVCVRRYRAAALRMQLHHVLVNPNARPDLFMNACYGSCSLPGDRNMEWQLRDFSKSSRTSGALVEGLHGLEVWRSDSPSISRLDTPKEDKRTSSQLQMRGNVTSTHKLSL